MPIYAVRRLFPKIPSRALLTPANRPSSNLPFLLWLSTSDSKSSRNVTVFPMHRKIPAQSHKVRNKFEKFLVQKPTTRHVDTTPSKGGGRMFFFCPQGASEGRIGHSISASFLKYFNAKIAPKGEATAPLALPTPYLRPCLPPWWEALARFGSTTLFSHKITKSQA